MALIQKGKFGDFQLSVTSEFDASCKDAGTRFHRFQDVYGRIRAIIANDPSQDGTVQPLANGLMVTQKDAQFHLPGIRILYRYNANNLVFGKLAVW